MFLTVFYMIATWMKAWQLRSIRTKLLEHVSADSCVVFYKVTEDVEECPRACSSLCREAEEAHVAEVLLVRGCACACALRPAPALSLASWCAPPALPARLQLLPPTSLHDTHGILPSTSKAAVPVSATDEISVLLEYDLDFEDAEEINILPESQWWRVLAWRVAGSRLALALRGDMSRLTSLAVSFLNTQGPLARLQTVRFEDAPRSLTEVESAAVSRATVDGSPRHRAKYIAILEKITDNLSTDASISHINLLPKKNLTSHKKELSTLEKTEKIEVVLAEKEKPEIDLPKNGTSNGTSNFLEEAKNKSPYMSKKYDLKLELSNKSAPEKSQPKVVTVSSKSKTTVSHKKTVTKTLGKKGGSNCSLLDQPIAPAEKANKGGGSCPSLPIVRPPNILIYSDSAVTRENIARTLRSVLHPERYAIYCTGEESCLEAVGGSGASLIVAGGALPLRASAALLAALLGGARVLSLCSDLLLSVLPYYRTAEVRERELVSFSYEKWRSVKLLHHVFCYQASPARRQFSGASTNHPTEYKGHNGHILRVEVLAAEQTWHTPSLLRATDDTSGGTAVFSQVHLELDAREYLPADGGSAELARLGVLRKLLGALGLATASSPLSASSATAPPYTPAYFLGTYERKVQACGSVCVGSLQLVPPKEEPPPASSSLTPLLLHACPDNFSTVQYFQDLCTNHLGRLLIYCEVLTSTQDIINEHTRAHGLLILADKQTKGVGRSGTTWLSPAGCLMFSLQVHTRGGRGLACRPSLLQHLVAVAFVTAVRDMPGFQHFNLRIKWPNDIYYGRSVKLGGLILNTNMVGDQMVFNIGVGINLDNSIPTYCLNDLLKQHHASLPALQREHLLAAFLNRLEHLYDDIQATGNFTQLYELYHKYWLHTDEEVTVIKEDASKPLQCRIVGLDEWGFLSASGPDGVITLTPDGNRFDMMKGLIAPKVIT